LQIGSYIVLKMIWTLIISYLHPVNGSSLAGAAARRVTVELLHSWTATGRLLAIIESLHHPSIWTGFRKKEIILKDPSSTRCCSNFWLYVLQKSAVIHLAVLRGMLVRVVESRGGGVWSRVKVILLLVDTAFLLLVHQNYAIVGHVAAREALVCCSAQRTTTV